MIESILALSITIERLTEWVFSPLFEKVEALTPYKWLLMYVAGALGIVAALQFDIDLLELAGLPGSVLGQVLSGVAIGGGANLLHDLLPGGSA